MWWQTCPRPLQKRSDETLYFARKMVPSGAVYFRVFSENGLTSNTRVQETSRVRSISGMISSRSQALYAPQWSCPRTITLLSERDPSTVARLRFVKRASSRAPVLRNVRKYHLPTETGATGGLFGKLSARALGELNGYQVCTGRHGWFNVDRARSVDGPV